MRVNGEWNPNRELSKLPKIEDPESGDRFCSRCLTANQNKHCRSGAGTVIHSGRTLGARAKINQLPLR